MPSPSPDLAATARQLEALPLGNSNAVAVTTGALLRVLVKLGQTEEAIAGLRERLRVLEKARAAGRSGDIVIAPRDTGYRGK